MNLWYKALRSVFIRRIVYEKNINTMYAVLPLYRLISSKTGTSILTVVVRKE